MRLQDDPYLPKDLPGLVRQLDTLYRQIAIQLNQLSEGRLYAAFNADTAAPTAGSYQVGDFVRNSAPSELGTAGGKYVITGWVCVSASPLAFKECRTLTGA